MLFHSRYDKTSFQKKAGFYSIRACLIIGLICMLLTKINVNAAPRVQDTGDKIVIVIDPGHGGENLGAQYDGYVEKEMTMTVVI